MYKRKAGILAFLFLFTAKTQAQQHEIGGGIGIAQYTGELSTFPNILFSRPTGQFFYRDNVSPSVTLRLNLLGAMLYASDKYDKTAVPKQRGYSMRSTISELSFMLEYNFLDYRRIKSADKLSPYMVFGLGGFWGGGSASVDENPKSAVTGAVIPIGVGCKFKMGKTLNIGVESIAHKTFSDYIDLMKEVNLPVKKTGFFGDKDWFFTTMFTVSYTIYRVNCPAHLKNSKFYQ